MSGTVNPGGQATTWYVEYGTSTSYGSQSASASVGSGSANVAVSRSLSGLASGTTYHYRVVATNGAGTSRGADGIFTTSAAPAAVTGSATSVTTTSATLNGTVDPNGRATMWYFEYGTSTSYGSKTAEKSAGSGGSAVAVTIGVSGLDARRLYHYRLVATSDAGTSRGADQTFSTVGAPAVTTDAASSIAPTSARLNGPVTPNGAATNWYFEYGTSTSYGSRTPAKNAGSGTSAAKVSFSLTGLRRTTTYHYRLVATNASGTTRRRRPHLLDVARARRPHGGGAERRDDDGDADRHDRPARTARERHWWFEYGTTTGYGSTDAVAERGLGRRRADGQGGGHGPRGGGDLPLPARREERRRHVLRRRRNVRDRRRHARRSCAQRRLRPRDHALRGRADEAGRRERDVFAQPLGEGSFRSVVTILTAADGSWRYLAKPRIRTSYAASWNGGLSAQQIVGVRPAIALRRTATGASRRASPVRGRSSRGRLVQLQRRTAAGRWVTIKRVRLNAALRPPVQGDAPAGTSRLRIAMSVNQAGAGYLAGFSRTIVFRRA